MKRTLVLGLVLASALTACSSDAKKTDSLGSAPSATSSTECTPSGTGTTDLATKPVYTVPKEPAPAKTTLSDIVCGTGPAAKSGSAVEVRYVGVNYKTGEEFDASWKGGPTNTFPFTVGTGVIDGFSIAVTGMQAGGRRLVVIPPAEGYGDGGPVPGGSLAFIIDLVKVS